FAGNLYGTPAEPVSAKLAAGVNVLLEIELAGARQVRARFPEALLIFLVPPSWEELVSRLTNRGTEAEDVIAKRLAVAKIELQHESEFDKSVISSTVEETGLELLRLVNSSPNM
ncbi:MAG: hypothetical protein RL038_59, partial [Actinomycetota bacterium]